MEKNAAQERAISHNRGHDASGGSRFRENYHTDQAGGEFNTDISCDSFIHTGGDFHQKCSQRDEGAFFASL